MNLISKLLPPSNIVLDLEVGSKKRMFEQAGLIFENNQGIAHSLVFDSLFARERLGSTGLGQGWPFHTAASRACARRWRLRAPCHPVPFDAPTASRST
jgi:mannitol/fructose-specific phosphotransferase system IIA component (Ntr-type)